MSPQASRGERTSPYISDRHYCCDVEMVLQRGSLVSPSAAAVGTDSPSCPIAPIDKAHPELVKHNVLSDSPARPQLKEIDPKKSFMPSGLIIKRRELELHWGFQEFPQ